MSSPGDPEADTGRPQVAILFAAFTDSWSLFDRLGSRASSVLAAWLSELETVAGRNNGNVIKTVGNGLLVTFLARDEAIRCAVQIMEHVSILRAEQTRSVGLDSTIENTLFGGESTVDGSRPGARARIGLHYGPVVREGGDVFGDAVNLAFRVQEQAAVEQIIATREVTGGLSRALLAKVRPLPPLRVKGKEDRVEVDEVVWEQDGATEMVGRSASAAPRSEVSVELRYRGRSLRVDSERRICVLGRGDTVGLHVGDTMASREHAQVEYRAGQLLLTDYSTNGTFLMCGEELTFLRRDSALLRGRGTISLGRAPDEQPEPVRFECHSPDQVQS